MKSVQEFLAELDTDEGKKRMQKFIDEEREKAKQARELITKESYIKWLEGFVKKHPTFDDDNWLYTPEKITEEDNKNVNLLCSFYRGIDQFAEENYISSTPCEFGDFYSIEYNGKIYEIGLVIGQGAVTFCNTVDVSKEVNIIHFEDIANPTMAISVRTASINSKLNKINELFDELIKDGVPTNVVIARAEKIVRELKSKK